MNKMKNLSKIWLMPLLLFMIIVSCDDRLGITTPMAVTIPTVSSTTPNNGATSVSFNSTITATFTEAMNSSSITSATFTLMHGTSFVSGTVSCTGLTATFTPESNLVPNTTYTATITTEVKDAEGSALANNYVWSFSTVPVVATPPTVTSTDPVNAATGVVLNKQITAIFSMPMDATSIQTSTFSLMQGTTQVFGSVSYSGTTASLIPVSNLSPNTTYTATITTGTKNLSGIALANNYVWSFTTGAALAPPTIISTDPANAAINVALNKQITATFSKIMDAATITTATFTLMQDSTFVSGTVSYTGTTATFRPESNLVPNTIYTATITTRAKDLAGVSMISNYVWKFTTSISYTVTLSSNPLAGGTTIGSGVYNSGASVTVTATPNTGYTFTNWTENGIVVTSSTSYQFTISKNRILVANFTVIPPTQFTVTLSSNPLAGGTTSGGGAFNSGSSVIVTATPNTGYTFTNWTESGVVISTNPIYQFTITGNRILVANFTAVPPTQYTVTLLSIPSAGGTTSGAGTFNSGSSVTVTATPNNGYIFTNWTENGIVLTSSTSYQFNITGNRTLAANFTVMLPTLFTVTLSSNPLAGGTTSGGGAFNSGSSVIVTATPNAGYTFTNWTEGGVAVSTNPIYQFTITGNRILVANFTAIPPTQFTVMLLSIPSAGGTTIGGGTYNLGASVTVTATPNAGYTFTNWTENGIVLTSSISYQFTINGDRTLAANFTAIPPTQFTITLSSNPLAGGTTSGSGTFNSGSSVTVTAAPNAGYTFTNWTEGGTTVSTNASHTFTIEANRTLVANFTAIPPTQFTVTLSSNPLAGGTTSGGGAFNSGSSVIVTATSNAGYTFTNWTENGIIVTSSASYQFNISGNRTLAANFIVLLPAQFSVTLSSNPLAGGTTSGGGTFNSGASVILTATPNTGYTFTNWTEGGVAVSTNPIYQFTITGNRILVANFTVIPPTQFTVTSLSIPSLGGTTSGGGIYNLGSSVTVIATPNAGYTFTNWTENGIVVTSSTSYQFTISGNRTLAANFTLAVIPYTVALSSNPLAGGTTGGGGSFNSGSSVTVTATPNAGYTFTNWTEGGTAVSTNANYTFTISGNRTFVANFTVIPYTVTLLSNPLAGGIASGGGTFNSGSSVTVTATPNAGYTFTNWTDGGIAVSTNASYTFTISSNKTLIANFTADGIPIYTVTLSSNPLAGGTTIGGGPFNSGSSVTVTATPNAGYTFTNWTDGGIAVSTNASYTFTISGNRTLVANYAAIQYTVALSSNPLAGGTTGGAGSFNSGSSVTVTATPNAGYTFTNWTDGGIAVSTNASYTFTISGNRTLVANFSAIQYIVALSSSPAAGGTTGGAGSFNSGSSVTVTASPNAGYTFTNWTDGGIAVSTNASYTFTISGNRTLVANFSAIQYTVALSSSPATGGTTGGAGSFNSGSSVTVTATTNAGYTFTNWTEGGVQVSTNASYTFTISANRTLLANFAIIQYTVALSSSPAAGGTTGGAGSFNSGSSVTVTTTANPGYVLINWTEGGVQVSTNASYTFTISGNRTLVANFAIIQYTVALSSNPLAGGTTGGAGSFNSGSSVTVTATPNAGYTFTNWTDGGIAVSTNASYTFTISGNRTLVANFAIIQYTVALSSSPAAGGTTGGAGSFNSGSSVTVTATPNAGYTFTNWTEGGVQVSTNASYTFTISGNRTLVANFAIIQYTVALSSNPLAGGTTGGAGSFNSGSSVTVTATTNAGYTFTNWTEGGVQVSTNASYTFTISGNRTLVANFAIIQYTVALSSSPAAGGTTGGAGSFNSGSSVTVTATTNAGYTFTNWTEGGVQVSTNASYTFTISGNRTLVANFALTGPASVNLGSAANFAVLAGSGVTNTGVATHIYGNVGSFPTPTITGLLPANVTGTLYLAADAAVSTAKNDLTAAYNDAQGRSLNAIASGDLGGQILTPGLYINVSGISAGILTLDAGGNPNAVWIFKMPSTLITGVGTSIVLTGGAQWSNIYWSVGSSATLGTNSIFYGNILADASITLTTGAILHGRALARNAAVTLDTNNPVGQ